MSKRLLGLVPVAALVFGATLCSAGGPFTFNEGVTIFEAEDFATNISPRSSHQWVFTNTVSGFSSNGYLEATPDNGLVFTDWPNTSPELRYDVTFPAGGTYYVWVRGYGFDGTSDSVHWGLDALTNSSSGLNWTNYNTWTWSARVSAGTVATQYVGSAGTHTFKIWMREDGARIDRFLITTTATFEARIGNSWHIPGNVSEPGVPIMRMPFHAIFSNTAVTIFNGNQYQGGANGANQLSVGSTIYYRNATNTAWALAAMAFHSASGNNKYFSGVIPANAFKAGDTVQYYLRIPYSDRLTTYLYYSNGVAMETELETVAQANPYSYVVLPTPSQGFPSPADWRDLNIYQIFTDRFNDGDPSNDSADPEDFYDPSSPLGVHGGDLEGIEQKLDYIKALGGNAIWISPIPLTAGTNVAYHGYVARNFYQLAPHWGTLADLSNMVTQAHARGIYVILDVVCNHQSTIIDSGDAGFPAYSASGYTMRWTNPTNQYPAPFNSLNNFHNHGTINDYGDANQVVLGDLRALDDLKTETEYVRTNLVNIYEYWMNVADFDGFRLDASKHAEIGFWQHWNPEIRAYAAAKGKTNFFTFGENISGDSANGAYTGTKSGAAFANDSALDYPLYFSINSVFAKASGNTKQIEDHYNAIGTYYDPYAQTRLVTFLDNHDRIRFMSSDGANNNFNRLALALAFLYSSRGIPCLYYGTEQSFNGGTSPYNREDMFDGQFEQGPSLGDRFNMTHAAFLHIARLNNLRRLYPSLRTGTHVNLWNSPSGPGLFAYERRLTNEEVVVILNTSGSTLTLTNRNTTYAPGTVLVNLFNTNEQIAVTASSNTPPVSIGGTSYKMFVAASLWKPLDPVVTSQVPSHATAGYAPTQPVTLRFSKPMDTNSVQGAFSVSPSVSGTFSWSGARDAMTFTPDGLGFAAETTIVVRVTNGIDTVSSNALYAPFETFFVTAASSVTDFVPPAVLVDLPAPGTTASGSLLVSGTATDNVAVQKVEIRMDGGNWLTATGTTAWSYTIDTVNALNGPHQVSARATDSSGGISPVVSVNVRYFNVPGAYDQRLCAGSPYDVTNCDDVVWMRDQPYSFGSFGYIDGETGYVGNVISGVCAQAQELYQRERFGPVGFNYVANCPVGVYEITLLDAETFWDNANQRVFDLYIEGQQALTNFDILAAAGGKYAPITLVFTAAVADAKADIQFVPLADAPRVSGVRLRKIGDVDTDDDGMPDWWMLAYFDHATGQDGDQSQADDDADGDGINNWGEYIGGTDPTNITSVFQINAVGIGAGAQLTVSSRASRVYSLDALPMFGETNNWVAVQEDVPGNNGDLSLSDTNGADLRLYRVRVRIP